MMKKKLLTAAIMAALTISTATAFAAAPTFSGDANIEYDNRTGGTSELTNRIRLVTDAQIDNGIYLHGRYVAKGQLNGPATPAGYEGAARQVGLEQMYAGFKFAGGTEIKAGRQPLWIANGMLADINGIGGVSAKGSLENVTLSGFYGQDNSRKVSTAEISTKIGAVNVGASYFKEGSAFWGVDASTKINNKTTVFAQFAKNNDAATLNKGFWAGFKVGDAAKKGDLDYSLAYVKVQDNMATGWITDGAMSGAQGLRLKAHYGVSDNSTLILVHDAFKTVTGDNTHNRTDLEYELRF